MKPTLKWLSTLAMGALMTTAAQARYIVADYDGKGINPNKDTHVIVAARGTDMGLQFHMAAAAQARKIQDVNPNDQVVLISVMEKPMSLEEAAKYSQPGVDATGEDYNRLLVHRTLKRHKAGSIEELLKRWGFGQFEDHSDKVLQSDTFAKEVSRFSRIASLNIYSHSTTFYGLIMDGPMNRIDTEPDPLANPDAKLLEILRTRFTPGAYAWFHGCNTGQKIIRDLTKIWGIPVTGAYTSTGFQELFFDTTENKFGFYHDGNAPLVRQDPKTGKMVDRRLGENSVSFKKRWGCDKVPCVRMFPDNNPYIGWWGDYRSGGGLGFYRTSCSSAAMPNRDVCYAGMARGLINQVSRWYTDYNVDLATFKKAAIDHLCPKGIRKIQAGYTYEKCAADLERSLTDKSVTVDAFFGNSLSCKMNGDCQSSWKCDKSQLLDIFRINYLAKGSCEIINKKNPNEPNRTMVDEYWKYVRGWEVLQSMKR